MLNRFYSKHNSILKQQYNKSRKSKAAAKDDVKAAILLLDEYEKAFAGSGFVVPYGCLGIIKHFNAKQLEQIIRERNPVIKPKTMLALKKPDKTGIKGKSAKTVIPVPMKKSEVRKQLDTLLQAELEFRKTRQVSKKSVAEIWKSIEKLEPVWKVVLGLKIVTVSNARRNILELVEPAVKLALAGKNQINNREISKIARLLIPLENDAAFKNVVCKLIRYYALEMCKWKKKDFKNNRTLTAYILELAYKCDNLKLYNKIIADFGFAEFADSCIVMANAGDVENLKKYLPKNYLKFSNRPDAIITPDGKKLADGVCDEIKDKQEKYVVRVLFAAPEVFTKANGKILFGKSTPQNNSLKELAKDFTNMKFSNLNTRLFCLKILISNSKSRDVLAYDGKKLITEINISSVITDPQLSYRTRTALEDLLYRSLKHGAGKLLTASIS
jgi:hypothetical protein